MLSERKRIEVSILVLVGGIVDANHMQDYLVSVSVASIVLVLIVKVISIREDEADAPGTVVWVSLVDVSCSIGHLRRVRAEHIGVGWEAIIEDSDALVGTVV